MATREVLAFYKAVYDGNLEGVKQAVKEGTDPTDTHFLIQTDEMCLCSLAFENLGLEFVEEYTPFDGNYAHVGMDNAGDNDNENQDDDGVTSDKRASNAQPQAPNTRVYQPPLLEWLESGQCGHVTIRSSGASGGGGRYRDGGNGGGVSDVGGGGGDEMDNYQSEDDLASDIDLEIYGVRISPQRGGSADDELDYEETRALLEHSRRIKQYEVPTPPEPLPAAAAGAVQPPTPKHHDAGSTTTREVTDSMNNLLLNEGSEDVTPENELPDHPSPPSGASPFRHSHRPGDTTPGLHQGTILPPQLASLAGELGADSSDGDYDDEDAVFTDSTHIQGITGCGGGSGSDAHAPTMLNPCKFPYFRELESLGSEDGVGSDFFLTEMKQAAVSPLHVASAKGHGDVIEYLVTSLGCDVNEGTLGSEDTPLHIAARWGHTDVVRLLLRLEADPHRINSMGYSALHLAIESNDQDCISAMLNSLTDLPSLDVQTKQVLLVHALAQDSVQLTCSLLEKLGLSVGELLFDCGSSIVHKTAALGSPACLRHLLEQGANPNVTNQEGETPLHVAAANGHAHCVKQLLSAGARPVRASNWMIGDNQTPTMLAAYNNYPDVVEVLLAHGHDGVTAKTKLGSSGMKAGKPTENGPGPAKEAWPAIKTTSGETGETSSEKEKASEEVIPTDRNVEVETGETGPTWCKGSEGECETGPGSNKIMNNESSGGNKASAIMEDVNCCSEYGDTALHYAAYRGCIRGVDALLRAGACVNKRNSYGATPLWNGVCHVDVLQLLIKAGADVNVQSSGHNLDHIDGVVYDSPRAPIEVAVEEGFFDSAEILLRAGCRVPLRVQRLLGEAYQRFDAHREVVPVLQALISQPPMLKQVCRAHIVHSIDFQLHKIENLDVDDEVRRYLRYHVL